MNVKLLKRVRDFIVKHPDKYDQGNWCGTRCCIAGHAAVMSRKTSREDMATDWAMGIFGKAMTALDLDADQADYLFLHWPERYEIALNKAQTPAGRARVAYRLINHFIRTKGAE